MERLRECEDAGLAGKQSVINWPDTFMSGVFLLKGTVHTVGKVDCKDAERYSICRDCTNVDRQVP